MGIEIKGLDINEVAKFLAKYYMKNAPYETTSKERPNSKDDVNIGATKIIANTDNKVKRDQTQRRA